MKRFISRQLITSTALIAVTGTLLSILPLTAVEARGTDKPALIISNEPLSLDFQSKIYSKPARAPQISAAQISGASYFNDNAETIVGQKVNELKNELFSLQEKVAQLSEILAKRESMGQQQAAEYYASIATISTQLQSGTTPGNPRLVQKLGVARENLEKLSGNVASLNDLGLEIAQAASMSAFLLDSARATYGLSGAIEEDHVHLAQLEDAVNSTVVVIERLLNNINDDISRTVSYLSTERDNLRTLSLAITTGDFFSRSLSNRPFSNAHQASFIPGATLASYATPPAPLSPDNMQAHMNVSAPAYRNIDPAPLAPGQGLTIPGGSRPLVKIRFDRPNVSYEQPVYLAVNEALSRYPHARFELIAVHPTQGNSAQVAIESTRARRNAEKVLRSLTQMGLDIDKIDLSYSPSAEASTNEVYLYVR